MDEALKTNCQRAFKSIVDALIDLEEYFDILDMDSNKINYAIELTSGGHLIKIDPEKYTVQFYQGNSWLVMKLFTYDLNDPDWVAKFINKIWEIQDARNSGN